MTPQKIKDIIPVFAKEHNLPEELVTKLVAAQFEAVEREVRNMDVEKIKLPYIGEFFAKPWTVKRTIDTLTKRIAFMHVYKSKEVYMEFRDHLELVYKNMQKRYALNAKIKERNYEIQREYATRMGKQNPDTAGDIQHIPESQTGD